MRPTLSDEALELLRDSANAEHACGDKRVATALRCVIAWQERDKAENELERAGKKVDYVVSDADVFIAAKPSLVEAM